MGSNDTLVTTNSEGGFSILPQIEQYITELGQQAYQTLVNPMTTPGRFANEAPLFLPSWDTVNYAPLEAQGLQLVQNMVQYGIPQPEAEAMAMQWMQNLPGQIAPVAPSSMWGNAMNTANQVTALGNEQPRETAGFNTINQATNQTPISNLYNQALGTSGQISNVAGGTQQEQAAENALMNLATGDMGNSPAVQSAIQGLESIIVPQIENQAATMGLANSGELVSEVGQAYANTLTPLYMQGLQQQESSANALSTMGNTMASRQMAGLQSLRDTQLAAGQNEEALQTEQMMRQLQAGTTQLGSAANIAQRGMSGLTNQQNLQQTTGLNEQQLQTDAANRYLNAATTGGSTLNTIGGAQTQRFLTPMQYAGQAGDVQHARALEQRQFVLDPFLRQREQMLSLMNPAGVSVISTSPTTTTQQSQSSGTTK